MKLKNSIQRTLCVIAFASMFLPLMALAQGVLSGAKQALQNIIALPSMPLEEQFLTAVKQNNLEHVKRLLGQGMNPMQTESTPPHYTALHVAVWEQAQATLEELLKHPKTNVDVLNSVDETPLMIAALTGNNAAINALIKAGAYPNKPGWTALHYAATNGHVEAIKTLLEAHALIDAESPNKTTPLMMAARSKNIHAVKLLIDEGADVDFKNAQGYTAIDFADKAQAKDIADGLRERARKLAERAAKPAWLR